MGKKTENSGFICANCGAGVLPFSGAGFRNHCPFCLCSLHVDINPGDRANGCGGVMRPVELINGKKGRQIRHKCDICGHEQLNVVCADDVQPDDFGKLQRLSTHGSV